MDASKSVRVARRLTPSAQPQLRTRAASVVVATPVTVAASTPSEPSANPAPAASSAHLANRWNTRSLAMPPTPKVAASATQDRDVAQGPGAPSAGLALGLAAVTLALLPLLLLQRHGELTSHGLVFSVAALTGTFAAVLETAAGGARPTAAAGAWPGGAPLRGYVLPLPYQQLLVPASALGLLAPLLLALGAAVVTALSAWLGGGGSASAAAASASGALGPRAVALAWLQAALWYGLALLVPSPGMTRPRPGRSAPGWWSRAVGTVRRAAGLGLRVALLVCGWRALPMGAGVSQGTAGAAWAWMGLAGLLWSLHAVGALAMWAAEGS
ncbi:hypothetical protein HYH03_000089 [Edaphochlamys debaryana]|uniref:Uncharacterized protein n=1 Tax=Edaphochlamys debaryana TaxID=47281 RepID=A0A835YGY5_9CHLO|nr:hypothetical protein HYH03_000089 [Edaphochlamys debaryana]|eukprot:KAG2501584.1 hypothetical protein HYH03_000089 [Edaphochlamys debaryana]